MERSARIHRAKAKDRRRAEMSRSERQQGYRRLPASDRFSRSGRQPVWRVVSPGGALVHRVAIWRRSAGTNDVCGQYVDSLARTDPRAVDLGAFFAAAAPADTADKAPAAVA